MLRSVHVYSPSATHASAVVTHASAVLTRASAGLGQGAVLHVGQSTRDGVAPRRGQRRPVGRPVAACNPETKRTDRKSKCRNIGKSILTYLLGLKTRSWHLG